ncbi:MAG TPA: hypothetical protein VGD37_39240 [Kofleriaceae bacterium]|jgi:hypothetical protein
MRYVALALVIVLAGACQPPKDLPEVAEQKAECQRLAAHIFEITPRPGETGAERGETDPKRIEALVAKLPVEDIQQCAAIKDRGVIACMQAAKDVAALRACIPAKKE